MENTLQIKSMMNSVIEENQSIRVLKTDVAMLKTDVREIKIEIKNINQRLDRLDEKFHYHGILFENMQSDIKLILEALIPSRERVLQIDRVEESVHQHDYRLNAVEISLKEHLREHQNK